MLIRAHLQVVGMAVLILCAGFFYVRLGQAQITLGQTAYSFGIALLFPGFVLGALTIALASDSFRKLTWTAAIIMMCSAVLIPIAGKFLGGSMGSAGWKIAMIGFFVILPATILASLSGGILELHALIRTYPGTGRPVALTAIILLVSVAGLNYIVRRPPDQTRLLSRIHAGSADEKFQAIEAFTQLRNAAVVQPLVTLLGDKSQPVHLRMSAARALANQIGDSRPLEPLLAAINADEIFLRENAIFALGQFLLHRKVPVDSTVIEALAQGLNDPEEMVRAATAQVLGWVDHPKIPEILESHLSDSSELVRYHLKAALVAKGQKR